ncbi:MBL fold metallo-hydrolase [Metabacillus indicus]|uniref:MBL fold metallo-hydrolase n=1 Tax=Metabacillus indicus TaxID=246786 RepID=UPI003983DE3D
MYIQQIRNATLKVQYAGKTFLIDPFFAEKHSMPPFPNTPNQNRRNPLLYLPVPVEELIHADAVIVTHLHPDHFDQAAVEALPKDITILAQSTEDAEEIRKYGFTGVSAIDDVQFFEGIRLMRTSGQHGRGDITKMTGPVSGIVFKHAHEPALYVAGDTVWCSEVEAALDLHQPEVVVVNGGSAQFLEGGPITMTAEDIFAVKEAAPQTEIVVSHMEALNHCLLTRSELHRIIKEKNLCNSVFVPEDGETLKF